MLKAVLLVLLSSAMPAWGETYTKQETDSAGAFWGLTAKPVDLPQSGHQLGR